MYYLYIDICDFNMGFKMGDIFDICNLDDVPKSIQDGLKRDRFGDEIIQLFRIANRALTVNEVYIAHFRMFSATVNSDGEYRIKDGANPKTKRQIMLKLYNMSKEKDSQIEAVDRGTYRLKKSQPNLFNL